ncbi:hypothetical protein N1851_009908 [Merluccius polli]|uniref:Uncharacterized protein n=1 Tax=Merluccius polli TaxID=89951 RepID=A0AA47P5U5_MERPO|nr:hypothetical protein N1851_009908 [Merluccius polli]
MFSAWCHNRQEDPATCPSQLVLHIVQSLLDSERATRTVKVYTATMSLFHEPVGGVTMGRLLLVSQAPLWDFASVLISLTKAPYEPIEQSNLKFLSHKTAFLLAICSAKRESDGKPSDGLRVVEISALLLNPALPQGDNLPVPGNLVTHSTRSVATYWARFKKCSSFGGTRKQHVRQQHFVLPFQFSRVNVASVRHWVPPFCSQLLGEDVR